MKTNTKARITCLFISKTTIMVNKRETTYFIISISDKQLSSFFFSLILSLFFYLYLLFVLVLSNLSGMFTFVLPTYLGGTFSPLSDTFERNFFSRWEGDPPPLPAYAPVKHVKNQFLYTQAGHTSLLLPDSP